MQLLQSWRESLAIFVPKNFKLFFLVTLKSIYEAFWVLMRYCWAPILIVVFGSFIYVAPATGFMDKLVWHSVSIAKFFWVTGFLSLLVFLAARPSVLFKDYRYFLSYWYYWGYIFLFKILSFFGTSWFVIFVMSLFPRMGTLFLHQFDFFAAQSFFVWLAWHDPGLLGSLFMLFLLDSRGTPGAAVFSVWRAVKMFVYNFPGVVILWLVASIVGVISAVPVFLLQKLAVFFGGGLQVQHALLLVALLVYTTVVVCFMTNFYVKRSHDQMELYFKTKEQV